MFRTRNLNARNERIETGVLVKRHKGKKASVDRKVGECHQWKATGQCSKGDSCSFSHGSNRGQKAQSSSLAPKAQTQNDGRKLSKGFRPGDKVLLKGKARKRAAMSSKESVLKFTSLFRYANSATNVCSDTLRLMGSPVKSRRKVVEKDQFPSRSEDIWVVCPKVTIRKSQFCGQLEN